MEKNDTYAIAVIGDEVLDNAIRENNSYVITDVMRSIGYQNSETRIIRDDVETIAAVVKELASAYTYVFTTGGIGPTHRRQNPIGLQCGIPIPNGRAHTDEQLSEQALQ